MKATVDKQPCIATLLGSPLTLITRHVSPQRKEKERKNEGKREDYKFLSKVWGITVWIQNESLRFLGLLSFRLEIERKTWLFKTK